MRIERTGDGLSVCAPAKVNLFLEIIRRREDGYHELESVFQTVEHLCDRLTVQLADGFTLHCDKPGIPCDEGNLVIRAARLLAAGAGIKVGASFTLQKKIPDGGGAGGGSSDAAAALRLCNELWGLGLEPPELARIGAEIGSDVPFFLYGGVCLCRGRGELVTPLPHLRPLPLTLVSPPWKISTPLAYSALRPELFGRHNVEEFLRLLEGDGDYFPASFTHFEECVCRLEPPQGMLLEGLRRLGVRVRMSGSGSCCWLPQPPGDGVRKFLADNGCTLFLS